MADPEISTKLRWLNICLVVLALVSMGATMAFLYLVVPWFFAAFMALYAIRFAAELWAWARMSAAQRTEYRAPLRFMNYNHILSVRMEWFWMGAGFLGLIGWIEYVRMAH